MTSVLDRLYGDVIRAKAALAAALLAADRYATCANQECQEEIDTLTRRRKPLAGQHVWCERCNRAGVRKRHSEMNRHAR